MSDRNDREQLGTVPSFLGRWGMTWFGFLGAAFAWLLHLLIAALVAEWGCIGGWGAITWGGVTIISWIIAGLTVAMLILASLSTWVARRCLLRFSQQGQAEESDPGTELFLARTGYRAGLLFIVIIVAESLPILFYLTEC